MEGDAPPVHPDACHVPDTLTLASVPLVRHLTGRVRLGGERRGTFAGRAGFPTQWRPERMYNGSIGLLGKLDSSSVRTVEVLPSARTSR